MERGERFIQSLLEGTLEGQVGDMPGERGEAGRRPQLDVTVEGTPVWGDAGAKGAVVRARQVSMGGDGGAERTEAEVDSRRPVGRRESVERQVVPGYRGGVARAIAMSPGEGQTTVFPSSQNGPEGRPFSGERVETGGASRYSEEDVSLSGSFARANIVRRESDATTVPYYVTPVVASGMRWIGPEVGPGGAIGSPVVRGLSGLSGEGYPLQKPALMQAPLGFPISRPVDSRMLESDFRQASENQDGPRGGGESIAKDFRQSSENRDGPRGGSERLANDFRQASENQDGPRGGREGLANDFRRISENGDWPQGGGYNIRRD